MNRRIPKIISILLFAVILAVSAIFNTTAETATTETLPDDGKFTIHAEKSMLAQINCNGAKKAYDESDGGQLVFTANADSNDPFFTFGIRSYCKKIEVDAVDTDLYKYVVMRVRINEEVVGDMCQLYYWCGNDSSPAENRSATATFYSVGQWEYIAFFLDDAIEWGGKLNGIRIDFTNRIKSGGIFAISDIIFCTDPAQVYAFYGLDADGNITEATTTKETTEITTEITTDITENEPQTTVSETEKATTEATTATEPVHTEVMTDKDAVGITTEAMPGATEQEGSGCASSVGIITALFAVCAAMLTVIGKRRDE